MTVSGSRSPHGVHSIVIPHFIPSAPTRRLCGVHSRVTSTGKNCGAAGVASGLRHAAHGARSRAAGAARPKKEHAASGDAASGAELELAANDVQRAAVRRVSDATCMPNVAIWIEMPRRRKSLRK